jgi:hypothetical protein
MRHPNLNTNPSSNPSIAAFEVIRLLAPSLDVLTVASEWAQLDLPHLFDLVAFPRLRDLVWDASPYFDYLIGIGGPDEYKCNPIPTLRRIHLVRTVQAKNLQVLAPNLDCLHISEALAPFVTLGCLLGVAPPTSMVCSGGRDLPPGHAPASLRHVHLQTSLPAFSPFGFTNLRCDPSWIKVGSDLRNSRSCEEFRYHNMVPGDSDNCLRVVLTVAEPYQCHTLVEHSRHWFRTMVDGDGPWAEPHCMQVMDDTRDCMWFIRIHRQPSERLQLSCTQPSSDAIRVSRLINPHSRKKFMNQIKLLCAYM